MEKDHERGHPARLCPSKIVCLIFSVGVLVSQAREVGIPGLVCGYNGTASWPSRKACEAQFRALFVSWRKLLSVFEIGKFIKALAVVP